MIENRAGWVFASSIENRELRGILARVVADAFVRPATLSEQAPDECVRGYVGPIAD